MPMRRPSRHAARAVTAEEMSWHELAREAQTATMIVGSLPLLILSVLWFFNRDYAQLLFQGNGRLALGAAMVLQALGMLVMLRMGSRKGCRDPKLAAATLGPRMTVPVIGLILPALFLIVLVPAILKSMDGG